MVTLDPTRVDPVDDLPPPPDEPVDYGVVGQWHPVDHGDRVDLPVELLGAGTVLVVPADAAEALAAQYPGCRVTCDVSWAIAAQPDSLVIVDPLAVVAAASRRLPALDPHTRLDLVVARDLRGLGGVELLRVLRVSDRTLGEPVRRTLGDPHRGTVAVTDRRTATRELVQALAEDRRAMLLETGRSRAETRVARLEGAGLGMSWASSPWALLGRRFREGEALYLFTSGRPVPHDVIAACVPSGVDVIDSGHGLPGPGGRSAGAAARARLPWAGVERVLAAQLYLGLESGRLRRIDKQRTRRGRAPLSPKKVRRTVNLVEESLGVIDRGRGVGALAALIAENRRDPDLGRKGANVLRDLDHSDDGVDDWIVATADSVHSFVESYASSLPIRRRLARPGALLAIWRALALGKDPVRQVAAAHEAIRTIHCRAGLALVRPDDERVVNDGSRLEWSITQEIRGNSPNPAARYLLLNEDDEEGVIASRVQWTDALRWLTSAEWRDILAGEPFRITIGAGDIDPRALAALIRAVIGTKRGGGVLTWSTRPRRDNPDLVRHYGYRLTDAAYQAVREVAGLVEPTTSDGEYQPVERRVDPGQAPPLPDRPAACTAPDDLDERTTTPEAATALAAAVEVVRDSAEAGVPCDAAVLGQHVRRKRRELDRAEREGRVEDAETLRGQHANLVAITRGLGPDHRVRSAKITQGRRGRLYLAAAPIQSWPRDARDAVRAAPGRKLVSLDYGQSQPRIVAKLSKDAILRADITSGDVYARLAEATGTDRGAAKRRLNAWINGATDPDLAARYPKADRALARWADCVERMGDRVVVDGLVGEAKPKNSSRRSMRHALVESRIVLDVLAGLDDVLAGRGRLVLHLHDGLLLEVDEGVAEEVAEDVAGHLRRVARRHGFTLPVMGATGLSWGGVP